MMVDVKVSNVKMMLRFRNERNVSEYEYAKGKASEYEKHVCPDAETFPKYENRIPQIRFTWWSSSSRPGTLLSSSGYQPPPSPLRLPKLGLLPSYSLLHVDPHCKL